MYTQDQKDNPLLNHIQLPMGAKNNCILRWISPELNSESLQRIHALEKITHPNIARTKVETYPNGEQYLVEEQAEYPLADFIDRLPLNSRLYIASQLCQTIEVLHDLLPWDHAYHGNLSLNSIKLNADGDIKLCDMALVQNDSDDVHALNRVVREVIGDVDSNHPATELLQDLNSKAFMPFQIQEALMQMVVGNDLEAIKDNLSIRNLNETTDNPPLLQDALSAIKNKPSKWLPESDSVFDDDSIEPTTDISASVNENYDVGVEAVDEASPAQGHTAHTESPDVSKNSPESSDAPSPVSTTIPQDNPYESLANELQTHSEELLSTLESTPKTNEDPAMDNKATTSEELTFKRHKRVEGGPVIDWQAEMSTPLTELESQMEPIEAKESTLDPKLFRKAEPHFIGQQNDSNPIFAGPAPENYEGQPSLGYPEEWSEDADATVLNQDAADFLRNVAMENAAENNANLDTQSSSPEQAALMSILDGHEFEQNFNIPNFEPKPKLTQSTPHVEAANRYAEEKQSSNRHFAASENDASTQHLNALRNDFQPPNQAIEPEESTFLFETRNGSDGSNSSNVVTPVSGRHSSFREELQSRFASTLEKHGLTNRNEAAIPADSRSRENDPSDLEHAHAESEQQDNTLLELPTFHSTDSDISFSDFSDSFGHIDNDQEPSTEPSPDERVNALIDLYGSGVINEQEYHDGIREMTQKYPDRYPDLEAKLEDKSAPIAKDYPKWVSPTKEKSEAESYDSFLGEQASEIDSLGLSAQESEMDEKSLSSQSDSNVHFDDSEHIEDALSDESIDTQNPNQLEAELSSSGHIHESYASDEPSFSQKDSLHRYSSPPKPTEQDTHGGFELDIEPEDVSVEEENSFFSSQNDFEIPKEQSLYSEEQPSYIVSSEHESQLGTTKQEGSKTTIALIAGAFVIGTVAGEMVSPGETFFGLASTSNAPIEEVAPVDDVKLTEPTIDLTTMTVNEPKTVEPISNIDTLSTQTQGIQQQTIQPSRLNDAPLIKPAKEVDIPQPVQTGDSVMVQTQPNPIAIEQPLAPQLPPKQSTALKSLTITEPPSQIVPKPSVNAEPPPALSISNMSAASTLPETTAEKQTNPNLNADGSLTNQIMNSASAIPATPFESEQGLPQIPVAKIEPTVSAPEKRVIKRQINDAPVQETTLPKVVNTTQDLDLDVRSPDEEPADLDMDALDISDEPLIDAVSEKQEGVDENTLTPKLFDSKPKIKPILFMDSASTAAQKGALSEKVTSDLMAISQDNPTYDRANAILLMNAQNTEDEVQIGMVLKRVMKNPDNKLNPVYLTSLAHHQVNMGQFNQATKTVEKAKFNWMKTPGPLKTTLYAEMIEIEAAAAVGAYYRRPNEKSRFMRVKTLLEKCIDYANSISDPKMAERSKVHLDALMMKVNP